MKYLLTALLLFISLTNLQAQETILYVVGPETVYLNDYEKTFIVGKPIVVYNNGKYEIPIYCATYVDNDERCDEAKKQLLKYNTLYILNNGYQTGYFDISHHVWCDAGNSAEEALCAKLPYDPKVKIITNNPELGNDTLKELKTRPKIKRRETIYGGYDETNLLTKVDIDRDGVPELIYEYWNGHNTFYHIYSLKKGSWKKVFDGGEGY